MKNSTLASAKQELKHASNHRRVQLADIAEHIAVQLVDLSDIAEQEHMYELQEAIDKAIQEAEYYSLYE